MYAGQIQVSQGYDMSTSLASLVPTRRSTVMALLAEAGVDVSDWSNRPDTSKPAASNPKYCYQWSFIQPGVCSVLNIWHEEMSEDQGKIFRRLNMRKVAEEIKTKTGKTARYRRALEFDSIAKQTYTEGLPVRVIISGRASKTNGQLSSKVGKRELDSTAWAVTQYDEQSGEFLVVRGASAPNYVDQFDLMEINTDQDAPVQKQVTIKAFVRDSAVRALALNRACGTCEYCGVEGFLLPDGRRYLETHHIEPLSEGGPDQVTNVIAICANCHRKSHYSTEAQEMRHEMLRRVQAS